MCPNASRPSRASFSIGNGYGEVFGVRELELHLVWEHGMDVQEAERRQSFVSSLNSSDFSSFNVLRNVRCEKNPIHGCAMIYRALYGNIQDIFVESCLSNEHIFPPPKALFPILDGKIPRPPK